MKLEDIIDNNSIVTLAQMKSDEELLEQIQIKLNALGLYPGGRWIDGEWGDRSEKALIEFCKVMQLNNMTTQQINRTFAETFINADAIAFRLETAKNRDEVFKEFFEAEAGFNATNRAFLDRRIENSPYKGDVDSYPLRLKEKPDNLEVISLGYSVTLADSSVVTFTAYPLKGNKPTIDDEGLKFLHDDIKEACVCVGSFVNGEIKAHWLGKNALNNVQFWSDTKFITILNLVCKANSKDPSCDLDDCVLRPSGSTESYSFNRLAVGVVSYNNSPSSSNRLAATFKRFETFSGLESWVKNITGNTGLQFRGNYGENPFINSPELFDQRTSTVLLEAAPLEPRGDNLVSAYDLTRFISMLGWHHHLTQNTRLPGAQWDSLESVVRAMGKDIARYVDVAIERLGLQSVIKSPVIISKVGWGRSDSRDRTEITYTALVQFIDQRPKMTGNPSKLRTLAMTLRAAKDLNDANKEAIQLDARMAAEVTEILRRVVTEELA